MESKIKEKTQKFEQNEEIGEEKEYEEFSLEGLDEIIDKHGAKEQNLISMLYEIQEEVGYLPTEVQKFVSKQCNIPLSKIHGVITFYSYFNTEPKGDHTIGFCTGTACYAKGGKEVLDKIKEELNIEDGETTEDGKFTLDTRRCIGCCGKAPVMMIDDQVFGNLTPNKIPEIFNNF